MNQAQFSSMSQNKANRSEWSFIEPNNLEELLSIKGVKKRVCRFILTSDMRRGELHKVTQFEHHRTTKIYTELN